MAHIVRDWMSSPVVVIDPDSSVSYALTLMRRRNIHSLVVLIDSTLRTYGIITTTDIRDKVLAVDKNPSKLTVKEIMTSNVHTARENWTLKECSTQMQQHNIHHMPVMDEEGELRGIISVTDLFIAAEEIGWEGET